MTNKMPKHSDIVKYWKDIGITSKGTVVNLKEANFEEDVEIVIVDIGEPTCWGCDKPINKVFENKRYNKLIKSDPFGIWNLKPVASSLERAHISPRALTNNNDVSNLFLLCPNCHKISPDHVNESHFFRFVHTRRKRYAQGINKQELTDFYDALQSEDVKVELSDFANIDINSNRINTHGFDIPPSTLLSEMLDVLKENGNN